MIDELKKFVSGLTEDEIVFLLYNKHIPYFEFMEEFVDEPVDEFIKTQPQQITHL